jgi:hypothetical protein
VQLEEALGRAPTLQEFGSSRFVQPGKALHEDIQHAWRIFSSAVDSAKRVLPAPVPVVEPEPLENVSARLKPETMRESITEFESRKAVPSPTIQQPIVHLNQETIARLQEESAQLQERLAVEQGDTSEQLIIVPPIQEPDSVIKETMGSTPEVDEDWQIILQKWQPEHWEIIRLLCQEQAVQLTVAERKDHRPVSQLIDEINNPVDEHLGDLLIDPDTQTLSPHLRVIAENLVNWYSSSIGR